MRTKSKPITSARIMSLLALLALPFGVAGTAVAAPCNPATVDAEGDCTSVRFDAAYVGDVWRLARGEGVKGTRYLDNLDLTLEVDGERALGVKGLTVFAYALYNNGQAFSGDLAGDAQGISNIEASQAVRLYEFWADYQFGATHSVRIGLYDLNSEFDAIEAGGLFLNPSHGIGADFAQSGRNGPSIFPVTSLAMRVKGEAAGWSWQAAVLDGVPGDPDRPRRTTVKLGKGDGTLWVGELGHGVGEQGRMAVGAWAYSTKFDDLVAVDVAGDPVQRRSARGAYALVEGPVYSESADGQGLSAFLRAGVADGKVHEVGQYVGAGLNYTGLLPGRNQDQAGIALAYARTSSGLRDAAALAGERVAGGELNLELTYRFAVNDWLLLQPDVQYVVNPGFDPDARGALALGLRFEVSWGTSWP